MLNSPVTSLMKVVAKLMKKPIKELLAEDFLGAVTSVAILTFRANYPVKMNGRKWLAPLYRPYISSFVIKKGQFVTVREGHKGKTVDIDTATDTYTCSAQEWREKAGYFLAIPPNRIKGSLAVNIKHIINARKHKNG